MQRRRGSYICIQGRTKLLFGKFGSKGAALFLACWGSVGWQEGELTCRAEGGAQHRERPLLLHSARLNIQDTAMNTVSYV